MKILIVYASAGAGHRTAALAVYNYLKANRKDCEVKIADCLDHTTFFYRVGYRQGYSLLVRRALVLWELAFWLTDFKLFRCLSRPLARLNNRLNARAFSQYLIGEQFDHIISTHFLPCDITAMLKRNREISSKLITVITDYEAHNYWICKGTDLYVVACKATADELISEGVEAQLVADFGIPVDARFTQPADRAGARASLGLDPDKFTCLLMTGSFGIGPLKEIVMRLKGKMQLIVLCSGNKKVLHELSLLKIPDMLVGGFVENPWDYMAASDCIITKPGGLSITEAMNMGLVPVFISAIPGQETGNIRTLAKYSVGTAPKSLSAICEAVLRYKDTPGRLKAAREAAASLKKPDCLKDISGVIR